MKNETLKNMAGVILFYLLIVFGVVAINTRIATINENTNPIVLSN